MPIDHFLVKRISTEFTDHEGIVFDNMDDAWEEATIAAGEMVKDLDGQLLPGTSCSIEVQDEFLQYAANREHHRIRAEMLISYSVVFRAASLR